MLVVVREITMTQTNPFWGSGFVSNNNAAAGDEDDVGEDDGDGGGDDDVNKMDGDQAQEEPTETRLRKRPLIICE